MTTPSLLELAHDDHRHGRRVQAEGACRRLLEEDPRHAGALHLLGLMAQQQRRLPVALRLMRMAVSAGPAVAHLHDGLGTVLGDLKRWPEALAAFARAVELAPDFAPAHRNRGLALARCGRVEAAADAYREAIRLAPDDVEARRDLIAVLHELGDLDGAIAERREILARRPADAEAHSELLVTLHYPEPGPGHTPGELFAEHRRWAERHADALGPTPAIPFPNDRSSDRPLRVGYVSGDLREHPVARFIGPALAHRDRQGFHVTCYSDVLRPDAVTQRLRSQCEGWRDVSRLSDAELAALVRRDKIDVLVDLGGGKRDRFGGGKRDRFDLTPVHR